MSNPPAAKLERVSTSSSEGRSKKVSIIGPPFRRSAMENKEATSIKRPADTTEEEDVRKGKKKRGKVWNPEVKVCFGSCFTLILAFFCVFFKVEMVRVVN